MVVLKQISGYPQSSEYASTVESGPIARKQGGMEFMAAMKADAGVKLGVSPAKPQTFGR